MNDVLFVSIKDNGIYNAVPWIMRMFISFISSFASDFVVKRQYISVTNARKVAVFLGTYLDKVNYPAFLHSCQFYNCKYLVAQHPFFRPFS